MLEPVVNLFEIEVNDLEKCKKIGKKNFFTSIDIEEGTLAMYLTSDIDNQNKTVIFEIYANEQAYSVHRKSHQFSEYVETAASLIENRILYELKPKALLENITFTKWIDKEKILVKLVIVTVKKEFVNDFSNIVIDEMRQSIKLEEGVLAMYAATLKNDETKWYFFEMYKNEQAYLNHRETVHFKKYINHTKDYVSSKELINLNNQIVVSKGKLIY